MLTPMTAAVRDDAPFARGFVTTPNRPLGDKYEIPPLSDRGRIYCSVGGNRTPDLRVMNPTL